MVLTLAVLALVADFVGVDRPGGALTATTAFRLPALLWETAQETLRRCGGTRQVADPPCEVRCRVWDPPRLLSRVVPLVVLGPAPTGSCHEHPHPRGRAEAGHH
jgi:hypothetical protein